MCNRKRMFITFSDLILQLCSKIISKRILFYIIKLFQNKFLEKYIDGRTPYYFHLRSFIITIKEISFEMSLETFAKCVIEIVLSSWY